MGMADYARTIDAAAGDAELRKRPRTSHYRSVGLRIEQEQGATSAYSATRGLLSGFTRAAEKSAHRKSIEASLIDVSKGGIGVETWVPLPLASLVKVAGELHSHGSCLEFESRAWVVHCLSRENGAFRIGLSFDRVTCRRLACRHSESAAKAAA
jgi:PilZ domain